MSGVTARACPLGKYGSESTDTICDKGYVCPPDRGDTADTTTITGLSGSWWGGVYAPTNGKIYGIPCDAVQVLIIDPATNTIMVLARLEEIAEPHSRLMSHVWGCRRWGGLAFRIATGPELCVCSVS